MMSLTSPIKPHMIHSMRLVKICFFEIFFQMISSLTFFYFSESHNKTYSTCIISYRSYIWPSLEAQLVKNPPVRQETWVQSLGWEDPLKKGKATHSSIWAWRIPRTVYIYIRVGHNWVTFTDYLKYQIYKYIVYSGGSKI